MTLFQYKIRHYGKILHKDPEPKDWTWKHGKGYVDTAPQYYLGNKKPTAIEKSHYDFIDLLGDCYLVKPNTGNTKDTYLEYVPYPIYPNWMPNITWQHGVKRPFPTVKTIVLCELKKVTYSNKLMPDYHTTYYNCLITNPNDNRTYVEWVCQDWIEPLQLEENTEESIKKKLLEEMMKRNEI